MGDIIGIHICLLHRNARDNKDKICEKSYKICEKLNLQTIDIDFSETMQSLFIYVTTTNVLIEKVDICQHSVTGVIVV